jgi:hypothetical protein
MTIKRVGPLSCAKIAGTLYAVLGLVVGIFVSLAALVGAFASNRGDAGGLGVLFGVGAVVAIPVFYGCIGFVGTLVMAGLYNALAGALGGIEVDIQ